MPRVAIIAQKWLPAYGGANRFTHDLATTLIERGIDVRVFCGMAAAADRDNGRVPAMRHLLPSRPVGHDSDRLLSETAASYALFDEACRWAEREGIEIAIIGNPWYLPRRSPQSRELFLRLRARGIKVGLLHFDTPAAIQTAVVDAYRTGRRDWDAAATIVTAELNRRFRQTNQTQIAFLLGSPLFFAPDFIVTCSDWVTRFVDPTGSTPTFVFHPPVDAAYWSGCDAEATPLAVRDVLMVNPQGRKGPRHMAGLIAAAEPSWTFRVLGGGWGRGLQTFPQTVAETAAVRDGRVEIVEYVPDMREAYRSARLLFFPSLAEGYGLTAVEPLYCGTPVVASSFPAILEGVGAAARLVCPLTAPATEWQQAVREVLADPEPWQQRGFDRVKELDRRQVVEGAALASFIRSQV